MSYARSVVLIIVMMALIVYAPFARLEHSGLYLFWGNADLLSFGCMAALCEKQLAKSIVTAQWRVAMCIAGAAVGLTILSTMPVDESHCWVPTILGLSVAAFLLGAAGLSPIRPRSLIAPLTTALSAFGRASYEIYLFHAALFMQAYVRFWQPHQSAL